MRRFIPVLLSVALVAAVSSMSDAVAPQAQPRRQAEPSRGSEPQPKAQPRRDAEPQAPPPTRAAEPERRAVPRPPAAAPQRQAEPRRRPAPPPRVIPPRYYAAPRVHFPPISLQRGFYYHPYFGFYYGPYYGPFYPYPGPHFGSVRYSGSALRTKVKPVETEVWVNGYFAGVVDDFDGVFQRLYLPAGEHDLEFHLDGYRNFRQRLYLNPGDTREITHQMVPASPGEPHSAPLPPRALPEEWTSEAAVPSGDRPASPFGILAIRVEPADAQIVVDGEVWLGTDNRTELVIHVPAGWHELEVRKSGYQTFKTEVELAEGARTRLHVRLVQ
jgi:hypothetical protein